VRRKFALSIIIKKRTVMKKSLITLLLVASVSLSFAHSKVTMLNTSDAGFENVLTEDPTFVRKGEKLVISFLNADLDAVEIRITDSKNNLVFAQEFDGEFIVQKAFDFSKAQRDDYKVVVAYKQIAVGQIVEVQ
jgi:hypothetical protein